MDHFDLIAPFYDRLSKAPDLSHFNRILKLPCKGHLLDAGGGTGRISSHLVEMVGQVVVTDQSHSMLRKAAEKALTAVQSDVVRLPFGTGSFERIIVVDSLHHFKNQRLAVRDLLRVLKTGGRLVIEEFDFNHMGVKLLALAEKMMWMRSRFLRPKKILEMIGSNGVSVKIEHDGRFTFWIIVDKI